MFIPSREKGFFGIRKTTSQTGRRKRKWRKKKEGNGRQKKRKCEMEEDEEAKQ